MSEEEIFNDNLSLDMITEKESIFHYTDANAILNIIKNKEFWITDSLFLNDSAEIVYINDIVEEAFCELEVPYNFIEKLQTYHKKYINRS